MERADPLFLLIGLPTIPVMLILGKMIRWEDYVLRLWRKYSNKLQILNSIFPGKALNYGGNEHIKLILWMNPTCKDILAIDLLALIPFIFFSRDWLSCSSNSS